MFSDFLLLLSLKIVTYLRIKAIIDHFTIIVMRSTNDNVALNTWRGWGWGVQYCGTETLQNDGMHTNNYANKQMLRFASMFPMFKTNHC